MFICEAHGNRKWLCYSHNENSWSGIDNLPLKRWVTLPPGSCLNVTHRLSKSLKSFDIMKQWKILFPPLLWICFILNVCRYFDIDIVMHCWSICRRRTKSSRAVGVGSWRWFQFSFFLSVFSSVGSVFGLKKPRLRFQFFYQNFNLLLFF
jgi:hypothetical protein